MRIFMLQVVGLMLLLARPCFTASAEPAEDRLQRVVVVFKTHFDIGYTDLASNVVARYRTSMIDKALDVCDASRDLPPEHRFAWTLPGWPMARILWPGQDSARGKRIEEAIGQGRLGTIVDPSKDAVPGSNFDVFCLTSGMTVCGSGGAGVGICPIDSPLVSIGRPGLYRHTGRFGDRRPVLFVNLFNNVWGTNFQQWTSGSWSCRLRIRAAESNRVEADLITPSWQARNPCVATCIEGPAGSLPPSRAGLQLSRQGVLVTAFGANPDGKGTILRLWEQGGRDGLCEVRLPEGLRPASVEPCDLRGRVRGKPIPVHDGRFEVSLTHYAPTTLLIRGEP